MCGIGGVRRFGEEPIQKWQIQSLLLSNERRGNDATGVMLQNEDEDAVYIWKMAKPASSAMQDDSFEEFLKEHLNERTSIAVVHTRAATSSDFRDNQNNHPLFRDDCAVVHNGIIMNHEWVFGKLEHQKPNCPTDSDVLRGLLDEYGLNETGMKSLNQLSGSVAMAAISKERPGWLMLVKSGSPLSVGLTRGQLVFASEKEFVYDAVRPFVQRFGILARPLRPELAFTPMANNSGWLIGPKGLEIRKEVTTTNYQRQEPDRSRYNSEFHKRRQRGSKSLTVVKSEVVKPLNAEETCFHCYKKIEIPEHLRWKTRAELECGECGWYMNGSYRSKTGAGKVN